MAMAIARGSSVNQRGRGENPGVRNLYFAENHLYVNGQEVSYVTQTQATGTKTTYPAYGFVMGTGLESVQRYFNGCLDDVLIFNAALSAHAIEALYLDAAGTGEKYYAHDAAGNLIRDDRGYRYSYDYENRLSKVEKPDGAGDWQTVATFEYDALGRRIRKISYDSVPSVATLYYYDPDWRCLEERDGSDVLQRSFVYGNYIDEVLVMTVPGSPPTDYYYLQDHLYSPVGLLASNGTVVERYEYDAYGTVHIMDASYGSRTASAYGNPYTFTGRRLDLLDTGALEMMYYRHRTYDAFAGRFLQHEKLGILDSILSPVWQLRLDRNLYGYATGNPILRGDGLGLADYALGAGLTPFPPGYMERYPGWGTLDSQGADYALWQRLYEAALRLRGIFPHASARLLHFLGNSGTSLGIPVRDMLLDSQKARDSLREEVEKAMDFVEKASEHWTSSNSKQFRIYSRAWTASQVNDNRDWLYALNKYWRIGRGDGRYENRTWYKGDKPIAICQLYELRLTYQVWDAYDWDVHSSFFHGLVTGAELKLLHYRGIAQEYNGAGAYDVTVKWPKG